MYKNLEKGKFPISISNVNVKLNKTWSHFYSRSLLSLQDRSAILDHAEPVSATGPPPYAEAVKDASAPLPPSYDQAVSAPRAGPGAGAGFDAYTAAPTSRAPPAGQVHGHPGGYPPRFAGHPASLSVANEGQNPSAPAMQ